MAATRSAEMVQLEQVIDNSQKCLEKLEASMTEASEAIEQGNTSVITEADLKMMQDELSWCRSEQEHAWARLQVLLQQRTEEEAAARVESHPSWNLSGCIAPVTSFLPSAYLPYFTFSVPSMLEWRKNNVGVPAAGKKEKVDPPEALTKAYALGGNLTATVTEMPLAMGFYGEPDVQLRRRQVQRAA